MIRTVVAAEEDYQLLIRLRFVTVIEATIFELLLVVAITSFWRASFCSSFFIYNLYTTQLSNLSICRWLPYQMGRLLDSFICVALPVNKNEKVWKNGFKKLADDFPSHIVGFSRMLGHHRWARLPKTAQLWSPISTMKVRLIKFLK